MGLRPVVVPMFAVVPLIWDAPDPKDVDAVAMTSANAARHGGAGLAALTHLPLFAVGEATAAAARAAGFHDVHAGTGDAADLAGLLKAPLRILHLTGSDHRPIPTDAQVAVVPVYETRPLVPAAPLQA
jgi:uroporphyrinogen-III synthase